MGGATVPGVKAGDTLLVTATFNETISDSPVPQISLTSNHGSVSTVGATNMTKVSTTVYTYSYAVPTGDATMTIAMHTGKDQYGTLVTSTPTSGTTIVIDNTSGTSSAEHLVGIPPSSAVLDSQTRADIANIIDNNTATWSWITDSSPGDPANGFNLRLGIKNRMIGKKIVGFKIDTYNNTSYGTASLKFAYYRGGSSTSLNVIRCYSPNSITVTTGTVSFADSNAWNVTGFTPNGNSIYIYFDGAVSFQANDIFEREKDKVDPKYHD